MEIRCAHFYRSLVSFLAPLGIGCFCFCFVFCVCVCDFFFFVFFCFDPLFGIWHLAFGSPARGVGQPLLEIVFSAASILREAGFVAGSSANTGFQLAAEMFNQFCTAGYVASDWNASLCSGLLSEVCVGSDY